VFFVYLCTRAAIYIYIRFVASRRFGCKLYANAFRSFLLYTSSEKTNRQTNNIRYTHTHIYIYTNTQITNYTESSVYANFDLNSRAIFVKRTEYRLKWAERSSTYVPYLRMARETVRTLRNASADRSILKYPTGIYSRTFGRSSEST